MIGEVEPEHAPSPFKLHCLWIINLIYSAKFAHRIKYKRGGLKADPHPSQYSERPVNVGGILEGSVCRDLYLPWIGYSPDWPAPSPTKRDWCRRARRVPTRMDLLVPSLCTLWAMNKQSMVKVRNVWDLTAISGDPGLLATCTAEQLILVVSGGRLDYVWKRRIRNSPCICLVMLKVKAMTQEARWLSHVFCSITWQQVSNIYQASSSIVSSVHSSIQGFFRSFNKTTLNW